MESQLSPFGSIEDNAISLVTEQGGILDDLYERSVHGTWNELTLLDLRRCAGICINHPEHLGTIKGIVELSKRTKNEIHDDQDIAALDKLECDLKLVLKPSHAPTQSAV